LELRQIADANDGGKRRRKRRSSKDLGEALGVEGYSAVIPFLFPQGA